MLPTPGERCAPVLHGERVRLALKSGENLRQAVAFKAGGRVEDAAGELVSCASKAVALQPGGDNRIVVRPD
jgi:hypothetical protein